MKKRLNAPIELALPFILALAIVLYLAYCIKEAVADEATVSWTAPTESEACVADSTPADPEFYNIYQLVGQVAHPITTFSTGPLPPGDYSFISTTVQAGTGLESRVSPPATKTVGPLTVVDDKAYTVVKSGGKFVAFIIGTVPVDTECDADNMVKGLFNFLPFTGYVVPVASVTITGDVEPSAVVAVCH
jgi:hypothetical protein